MKRSMIVSALALVILACGPREPPKQANIPDPPDPTNESPSGSSGTAANTGSSGSSSGHDVLAPPPGGGGAPVGKSAKGEAPNVASLAIMLDGVKWGMSHAELTKAYTETGGVIWKDYDEKLAKARVGPEQTALEAEREQVKGAFVRSFIEFKDTPTGFDSSALRSEYTYRNKESLMWAQRQGKKRFFFFINDRLWKVYDEVPLVDNGPYGKAYVDAVNKLNGQLGVQGRVLGADPAKGIDSSTVDWKDSTSHLRAVDRSREHLVGLVLEDNGTLANIAALRSNKAADPNEIDPSIVAVTKGTNRVDPNAAAAPGASASGKKAAPPAPKKK